MIKFNRLRSFQVKNEKRKMNFTKSEGHSFFKSKTKNDE